VGNSIYISKNEIQAVGYTFSGGKVKINDFISVPLSEDCIINGIIADDEELKTALAELNGKKPALFKKPILTIDSSTILYKKIQSPILKDEQYRRLVSEELRDKIGVHSELVFDYSVLSHGKTESTILGTAADKPVIDSYVGIFSAVGIKVDRIIMGLESVIRYVAKTAELREGTIALNIVDGISMLSVIFENGEYMLSTRTRIVGEDDDEISRSISQSLSFLIQFNKMIKRSVYIGLSESIVTQISESRGDSEVKVESYNIFSGAISGSGAPATWHFTYFSAFADKSFGDILVLYKATSKPPKKKKPYLLPLSILLVFVAAVVAMYIYNQYRTGKIIDEVDTLTEYIFSEEVILNKIEFKKLQEESGFLNASGRSILAARAAMGTEITRAIISPILQNTGGSIIIENISVDSVAGSISVSALAATQDDASAFATRLKTANASYTGISYTGYSNIGEQYSFSITISLGGVDE